MTHLTPNGVLCGDDWNIPDVRKGVEKAARFTNKNIFSSGNFWKLEDLLLGTCNED